ncbi:carrier superfamily protein [Besnoitia besnoiti]|uniref:Carrier superfamily protein n=1 Tax=Besnoitia besnoiti TaxID=94643 RepID=A0A2A9MHV0_BESBE|nr:carrier superfamily protein [Besnoitia besnoiti]PFH38118.1 carrier superfamily protein [Besnoitia besnoiti]
MAGSSPAGPADALAASPSPSSSESSASSLVSPLASASAMPSSASACSPSAAAPLPPSSKDALTPFERMFSGMASGILTKTACAPMDRLRLLFQVQGMLSHQRERQVPARQPSSSSSAPAPSSVASPASASARSAPAEPKTPLATAFSVSQRAVAASGKKYSGVLASLRLVVQEEGVAGLWRGNGANACRAAAAYAVKFPTNDWACSLLERMQGARAGRAVLQSAEARGGRDRSSAETELRAEKRADKRATEKRLGVGGLMIAGSLAGALQKALCYPLDLVSVRIAVGINTAALAGYAAATPAPSKPQAASPSTPQSPVASSNSSPRLSSSSCSSSSSSSSLRGQPAPGAPKGASEARLYAGIWHCVKRIYVTEGVAGFYKGFAVALWSGVPYVMLQMTFYELWKREIEAAISPSQKAGATPSLQAPAAPSVPSSYFKTLLASTMAGSLANFMAQLVVFPFDTARKRLMTDGIDGRQKLYSSCRACMLSIYRREGFAALFAGLWPATLRCLPAGALQFASYECFKFFFQMQHEKRMR